MPAASLTVGNVEITALLDVDTSIPLAELSDGSSDFLPAGEGSLAVRYPDDFTANGWHFRAHCFLVAASTRLTLIDTGIGPADSAFARWLGVVGSLPEKLARVGVVPGDVETSSSPTSTRITRGGTQRRLPQDGRPGSPTLDITSMVPTSRGCGASGRTTHDGSSRR
jgi:hypothetical protein